MANKKLKIAFIGWANSEHVKRWVKWFADQGHEVHLISNVFEKIDGVQVHSLQDWTSGSVSSDSALNSGFLSNIWLKLKFYYLSYLKYPGYIMKTKKLLNQIKPDILQGFYIGFAGYIGAFINFHPFMVWCGGPDVTFFPKRFILHRLMTKYALSKIDFLTHTSEDSNAAAIKMGYAKDKTKFIHLGVDLEQFNAWVEAVQLHKELGLENCRVILSTRALSDEYYNISTVLKAFAKVWQKIANVKLILIYYAAPEKKKLQKLADKLGINGNILWIGKVEHSAMAKYYTVADVYVTLSLVDSGPVSLLEAMACGTIPVVSRTKNIAEWIEDGVNGYLVDPIDVNAAAQAILVALSDPAKKKLFAQRNVQIIRKRADQEKCFREIERITLELVDKRI